MKVLLCGIGKLENKYIREWVEYHRNLGFTNIVLYDNNDIDGEVYTDVIGDYIKEGYVKLENWRGVKLAQVPAYNDCYKKYKNSYDWIGFWDIDEFIEFEKVKDIKDFLSDIKFKDTKCVRFCWKQYTDNGLIDTKGDYSMRRFTEVFDMEFCRKNNIPLYNFYGANTQCKSIYRTNVDNFLVTSPHCHMKEITALDANGDVCWNGNVFIGKKEVWEGAWLNHYRFRTIGEYVRQKMVRLWPTEYGNGGKDKLTLSFFFDFNKKTSAKEKWAEELINNRNVIDKKEKQQLNFKNSIKKDEGTIKLTAWVTRNKNGDLFHKNWGDELGFFLFPLIFNRTVTDYKKDGSENYAIIGSILHDGFIDEHSIIWGAGTQDTNLKLTKKPQKVCAVRGPLTREFLINNGIECPEVYGDPALLLPKYYNPKIEKKYKIGFIPHWESLESEITKDFVKKDGVHLIKMKDYKKWTDVIDEVLSCNYIVSESLHGLILAEAYGIPNIWANITLKKYDVKFHDFFLSIGRDRNRPIKITKDMNVGMLDLYIGAYRRGFIDLKPLMDACPIKVQSKIENKKPNIIVNKKEEDIFKEKAVIRNEPTIITTKSMKESGHKIVNLMRDGAIF